MGQNVTKRKPQMLGERSGVCEAGGVDMLIFTRCQFATPKHFSKRWQFFFFDMSFPSKSVLSFNFLGRSDFSKTFSETFFRYLAQEPYAAVQDGEGNNEARQYLQ